MLKTGQELSKTVAAKYVNLLPLRNQEHDGIFGEMPVLYLRGFSPFVLFIEMLKQGVFFIPRLLYSSMPLGDRVKSAVPFERGWHGELALQ